MNNKNKKISDNFSYVLEKLPVYTNKNEKEQAPFSVRSLLFPEEEIILAEYSGSVSAQVVAICNNHQYVSLTINQDYTNGFPQALYDVETRVCTAIVPILPLMPYAQMDALDDMDRRYVHVNNSNNNKRYKDSQPIMHMTIQQILSMLTSNTSLINKRSIWWSILSQTKFQPTLQSFNNYKPNKLSKTQIRALTRFNFVSFKDKKSKTFYYNEFSVTTSSKKLFLILESNGWVELSMAHGLIDNPLVEFASKVLKDYIIEPVKNIIGKFTTIVSVANLMDIVAQWTPLLCKIIVLVIDPALRQCQFSTLAVLFADDIVKVFGAVSSMVTNIRNVIACFLHVYQFLVGLLAYKDKLLASLIPKAHGRTSYDDMFKIREEGINKIKTEAARGITSSLGFGSFGSWEDWINRLGRIVSNTTNISTAAKWLYTEMRSLYYTYVLKTPMPAEYQALELELWCEYTSKLLALLNSKEYADKPLRIDHYHTLCNLKQQHLTFFRKFVDLQRNEYQRILMLARELNNIIENRRPAAASYVPARDAPFTAAFFGETGVGKSTAIEAICREVGRLQGVKDIPIEKLCFNRLACNAFFDGYAGQLIYIADDWAQSLETFDDECVEFIRISNRQPFQLHMSDVADKKHCFFTSPYAFVTCGKHPADYDYKNTQGSKAVLRRFDIVVEILLNSKYNPQFPTTRYGFRIHDKFSSLPATSNSHVKIMDWNTFIIYMVKSIINKRLEQSNLSTNLANTLTVIDAGKVDLSTITTETMHKICEKLDFSMYEPNFTDTSQSVINPYPSNLDEEFKSAVSEHGSINCALDPVPVIDDNVISYVENCQEILNARNNCSTSSNDDVEQCLSFIPSYKLSDGTVLTYGSEEYATYMEEKQFSTEIEGMQCLVKPGSYEYFRIKIEEKNNNNNNNANIPKSHGSVCEDKEEENQPIEVTVDSNINTYGILGEAEDNEYLDAEEEDVCVICAQFKDTPTNYYFKCTLTSGESVYSDLNDKIMKETIPEKCGFKCVFRVPTEHILDETIFEQLNKNLHLYYGNNINDKECAGNFNECDCRCSYATLLKQNVFLQTLNNVPVLLTFNLGNQVNNIKLNRTFLKLNCLFNNCPTARVKSSWLSRINRIFFKTFPSAWWLLDDEALMTIGTQLVVGFVGGFVLTKLLMYFLSYFRGDNQEHLEVPDKDTKAHGNNRFQKQMSVQKNYVKFDRNVKRTSIDEWSGTYSDEGAYKEARNEFTNWVLSDPYVRQHSLEDDWLARGPKFRRMEFNAAHMSGIDVSLNKNQIDKINTILNNCCVFKNNEGYSVRALSIVGRCFLVVKHFADRIGSGFYYNFAGTPDDVQYVSRSQLLVVDILSSDNKPTDLCVVALISDKVKKMPSLLKFIPTVEQFNSFPSTFSGAVLGLYKKNKVPLSIRFTNIKKSGSLTYALEDKNEMTLLTIPESLTYDLDSSAGECTNPVISFWNLEKPLCGLHCSGIETKSHGIPLTLDIVNLALAKCKLDFPTCHVGYEELPIPTQPYAMYLIDNSYYKVVPPRFVQGSMLSLGKIDKKLGEHTVNTIVPSDLSGWSGGIATTAPAILKGTKEVDGYKYTIKEAGVMKLKKINPILDPRKVALAGDSYITKLKSVYANTPGCNDIEMKVLTLEQVTFGDPMYELGSTNTAAAQGGWYTYHQPGAIKALEIDLDAKTIGANTRNDVSIMISKMEQGIIPAVLCIDHLKMERRPLEKVEAKKTRVFNVQEYTFNLVGMMYFGAFLAKQRKSRIYNESIVGIKYTSKEWDMLARYLKTKTNKHYFAGDIENFDGSQLSDLEWAIYDTISHFYPPNEKDDMVRMCMVSALIQSIHCCSDNLYMVDHGNTSGNWMTTDWNSSYVSLAMRYIFCCVFATKQDPIGMNMIGKFNDKVSLVVNGDDNILAVSDDIATVFTPTAIKTAFETHFLTSYTNAQKSSVMKWETFDEISILKRDFYFDPDFRLYLPRLKLDVVLEMLWWCKPKSEDYPFYMSQVASAVSMELCFHDLSTYKKYSDLLQEKYYNSAYSDLPYHHYNRDILLEQLHQGKTIIHELFSAYKCGENLTQTGTDLGFLDHENIISIASAHMSRGDNNLIQSNKCASQNKSFVHGQLDITYDYSNEKLKSPVTDNITYKKDLNSSTIKQDDIRTDEEINAISAAGTNSKSVMTMDNIINLTTETFLSRPAVTTIPIDSSSTLGTVIDSFDFTYVSGVSMWAQQLDLYTYFSYDLEVELKISAPPSACGGIVLCYAPRSGSNIDAGNASQKPVIASSLPNVMLDIGSGLSVKLNVPFVSHTMMMNDFADSINTISAIMVAPYRSDGAGATLHRTVRLRNVRLALPRAQMSTETNKQGEQKAQEPIRSQSLISGLLRLGARGLDFASNVASFAGFDKENNHAFPMPMIENPTRFWGGCYGPDNSVVANANPFSSVDSSNSSFWKSTNQDELDIQNFCDQYTIFHTATDTTSQTALTRRFWFPVTPVLCSDTVTTSGEFMPTKSAALLSTFRFWRADVHFKIKWFKNAYIAGRYVVVYFPFVQGQPPSTVTQEILQSNPNIVCDLSVNTECEFVIPFTHKNLVCSSIAYANGHTSNGFGVVIEDACVGYVAIYTLEKLTTLNTFSTTINYIVMMKSSNVAASVPQMCSIDPTPSPFSGNNKKEKKISRAHMELVQSQNRNNKEIMVQATGSCFTSISQLLKIKATTAVGTVVSATMLTIDSMNAHNFQADTFLNLFSKYFAYYRGGFRIALTPGVTPTTQSKWACYLVQTTFSRAATSQNAIETTAFSVDGTYVLVPVPLEATKGLLEVELPWSSNFLAIPTDMVADPTTDACSRPILEIGLDPNTINPDTEVGTYRVFICAADDFRLAHFRGVQTIIRV